MNDEVRELGNWIRIFHGEVRCHSASVIFLFLCEEMESCKRQLDALRDELLISPTLSS